MLHSASCFLFSHRQTDYQHWSFTVQCLGKHQMCCLEGALHFVLSCSGWQTRQRLLQAASLSLGNSSQVLGLKAINLSYIKPAAIEATVSGWTTQQFAFLGGKLNLRATFAYSLQLHGRRLVITVVGYSSPNSEHRTFYPPGSPCSPNTVSRQTLRDSCTT